MSPEAAKSDNSSSRDLQSAVLQTTLQEISSRPTEPERGASADDCCVICLDQITEGCEAQPCHHRNFDYLCLVTWLEQQAACPLCKTEIKEYDPGDRDRRMPTPRIEHLFLLRMRRLRADETCIAANCIRSTSARTEYLGTET
ncbi:hypothetical protein COL26b_003965 [Colletotrichum chrysophilum]|uniref:uncharacterized protein n=1 Tax=Colletotrichum chrysophilum TaxID=1836956 RepID=UPI0023013E4A|nr:uncharacterized protein COL26b_003965 [Colletotrichum chrysophilum]KAJ0377754.1 hypothetical protein COL26b_003965 [Colletotrichum chrysophilum]